MLLVLVEILLVFVEMLLVFVKTLLVLLEIAFLSEVDIIVPEPTDEIPISLRTSAPVLYSTSPSEAATKNLSVSTVDAFKSESFNSWSNVICVASYLVTLDPPILTERFAFPDALKNPVVLLFAKTNAGEPSVPSLIFIWSENVLTPPTVCVVVVSTAPLSEVKNAVELNAF